MITNICLLLEALSVVICLHHLYGEKFRLDIATLGFLSVNMIIMTVINYYALPKVCTMVIYPIIAIYCIVQFGVNLEALIVNNILYMILVGTIQLLASLICYVLFKEHNFENMILFIINIITFIIVVFILPECKLNRVSNYLQDKEKIYIIALIASIIVAGYVFTQYKSMAVIELGQGILLLLSILLICALTIQVGKYKVKSKEIETELKMHKLYADSFRSLIEDIRARQHEFDNHISTVYSQHYIYHTYEDLVMAQKEYCQDIIKENRYNNLLKSGNPVVSGFLYGKFMEIEKLGINVDYKIFALELNGLVPVYKTVEILGNLIKNATEELENRENDKRLFVSFEEKYGFINIEVRNINSIVSLEEINKFFTKGYSRKGNNRGLGLYNIKNICNEYTMNIQCENKIIDGENWLSFSVVNNEK